MCFCGVCFRISWGVKLTEVEKRKDLGGCGRLDLGLNDGGGGAVQGARFLRLNATITEIHMFVPEFFDSSCTKNQIHFFKMHCKISMFFFVVIFEYHLEVWKASIFFYMNGFPFFFSMIRLLNLFKVFYVPTFLRLRQIEGV